MKSLLSLLLLATCLAAVTTASFLYPVLKHDYVNDLTPYDQLRGSPYNVSFNGRAVAINGQNVLLQSGSIHYPRSTPEMWSHLMDNARAGGLNTIQVYLFWNYHEADYRQYDFKTENRNLAQFIQTAADKGLFINLRIGPFVCAEWTLGGIPQWVRELDIPFRTNNTVWENEMEVISRYVYKYVEPFLAKNGGPIILIQLENEYDNMEGNDAGNKEYLQWVGGLTQRIDSSVTWIMCSSHDAPSYVINTCNGFYCDAWIDQHQKNFPNQPPMWTEDWSGWFYAWGEAKPTRPAEDLAFAVARWIARGGAHHNYYMYHGGTTFGRWTGGPQDTTGYDYNAPLDEYGFPQEPKYSHTTTLHNILSQFSDYLLGNPIAIAQPLGKNAEVHVYGTLGKEGIFFASNFDDTNDFTGDFNGQSWTLPAWSVTIVDAISNKVLYQSSTLSPIISKPLPTKVASVNADPSTIEFIEEPIGLYDQSAIISTPRPIEQLHVTLDKTDFMWHVANVTVTDAMIAAGSVTLSLTNVNELFYVYFNNKRVVVAEGVNVDKATYTISLKGMKTSGTYPLQIVVLTMGSANCCGGLESFTRGLEGKVVFGDTDITSAGWSLLPYLQGERQSYVNSTTAQWMTGQNVFSPLTWYRLSMTTPKPTTSLPSWQLDLTGMGKGQAWVNGHHIGRYWLIQATKSTCPEVCDYRGSYNGDKCRVGCGEPSLRLYHVPREWLNGVGQPNSFVFLEERGGDPATVTLLQRN